MLLLAAVGAWVVAMAQEEPALLVSPSKATMLVGETHTFRAVGKDGRMRHNVRWSIVPESAATLTIEGDEATVQAEQTAGTVILTAYVEGASAEASIEIREGTQLPIGSVKWSVSELPGCKTTKIIPAVPSAGGPDIYAQEMCKDGEYVRAILEDGRELWRRKIGPGSPMPADDAKEQAPVVEHINLKSRSVCDAVATGMNKEGVAKMAEERSLQVDERERAGSNWVLEEQGFRCQVTFDGSGAVIKKKKTILNE